jgi:hypothetical protein
MTTLSFDYDVAVVGAGPAGLVAALRAAELADTRWCCRTAPGRDVCPHRLRPHPRPGQDRPAAA